MRISTWSARRMPTPGPRSISRAMAGRSSRQRSRSTRASSASAATRPRPCHRRCRASTRCWTERSAGSSARTSTSRSCRRRIWSRAPSIRIGPSSAPWRATTAHGQETPSSSGCSRCAPSASSGSGCARRSDAGACCRRATGRGVS